MIRRCGNRVAPMTAAELGSARDGQPEALPSFWQLFAPGQIQWTAVAVLCGICGSKGYYLIAILLPKALVDQGAAVAVSFGLEFAGVRGEHPGQAVQRLHHGDYRPALDSFAPFLMASHTGSPAIFFGTMVGVVAVGACIPLMFGRETLGNLEAFIEPASEPA